MGEPRERVRAMCIEVRFIIISVSATLRADGKLHANVLSSLENDSTGWQTARGSFNSGESSWIAKTDVDVQLHD